MFVVFVVTEVVSITSEKVTDIVELTDTDVSESEGEVEATVGAVVSVVVVLSVVPVAEYSSFSSLQEVMVRLKNKISKMNKILFIFSSIPKVKYYGWVYYENPIYNINLFVLQECGGFIWRVSDCEELVGVTHRR